MSGVGGVNVGAAAIPPIGVPPTAAAPPPASVPQNPVLILGQQQGNPNPNVAPSETIGSLGTATNQSKTLIGS